MRTNLRNARFWGGLGAGVLTLALAIALSVSPPADAKPPGGGSGGNGNGGGGGGGGEPVPPGTLYYRTPNGIEGVLADGSGGEQAFDFEPTSHTPSNLIYSDSGTDYRLWLAVEESAGTYITPAGNSVTHRDLFVYRDIQGSNQTERFQLTDLFGSFLPMWGNVRWSNDGQDSFISFGAADVRNAQDHVDVDGNIHLDGTATFGIYRIEISGSMIDGEPLIDDPQLVETIVTFPSDNPPIKYDHGWSSDGTKLAYLFRDGNGDYDVYVKDFVAVTDQKVYDGTDFMDTVSFSPTDDIISVNDSFDVVLIDPTTGGSFVLTRSVTGPYWSPDGNHLSIVGEKRKGLSVDRFLSRIEINTGEVTNVTPIDGNIIVPWVSNDTYVPEL